MSGSYTSDFSLLNSTFWVDLLSQRDVSSQVPINYVTQPSVALTAACFGDNQYLGDGGSLCLSDLLTIGYRRFIIDLYWSHSNQQWLLCPVSIPSTTTNEDESPYKLGDYTCSGSFDLTTITGVLLSYIQSSSADIDSTLLFVVFNVHAAADPSSPDQPASVLSSAELPPESLLLGNIANDALYGLIYTPPELAEERSNLNDSWYHETSSRTRVLQKYFTTTTNADDILSTPDGWPCQAYLINKLAKRLILGRGNIDPQLQGYNASGDDAYIFPASYIEDVINVSTTSDGNGLQPGCFYSSQTTSLKDMNTSWALSTLDGVTASTSSSALLLQNYTGCGISPIINQTLGGQTADIEVDLYRNISISSMWSWATGEPRNASSLPGYGQISINSDVLRCAMLDPTSNGHWRAGNCSNAYRAACRVDNDPYTWILSDSKQTFYDSGNVCSTGSVFDVPRTGLENTFLYNEILSTTNTPHTTVDEPVWINLNSIDVQYCWVMGGANATCLYVGDADSVGRRTILVPTIAAIIILVITAATIFVKCNSNRRISRRKRVSQGWEYEGVPS